MNVLLTGAHGTVGTAVTSNSAYEYVLLDRREAPAELGDGTPHPHRDRETIVFDVGDPDAADLLADLLIDRDVDAVVHLAGDPQVAATYESVERNNVRGTRNVLEAAQEAGLGSVVFSSSNHAVGMYEEQYAPDLYDPEEDLIVDHESPLRPDSDYGASKAAGEAWCRLYAERHWIDCYALRIGTVRNPTTDHPFGLAEEAVERGDCVRGDGKYEELVARMRCTWLSRRDCAALVDRCLDDGNVEQGVEDGPNPETVSGGTFEIFYGISDNPNSWFDVEHARERVGYDPADSGSAMASPPE